VTSRPLAHDPRSFRRARIAQAAVFAALVAAGLAPALAQDDVVVETAVVTTYLNGGIGQTEEAAMKRLAKDFPLRLTFSERKDDEYIANVPVVISDAQGNPVFELDKSGPMLYVILPNGKYKVSARFKGLTETKDVTIDGSSGKDLYFHWTGTRVKG